MEAVFSCDPHHAAGIYGTALVASAGDVRLFASLVSPKYYERTYADF
jgi:hypothetical protein